MANNIYQIRHRPTKKSNLKISGIIYSSAKTARSHAHGMIESGIAVEVFVCSSWANNGIYEPSHNVYVEKQANGVVLDVCESLD